MVSLGHNELSNFLQLYMLNFWNVFLYSTLCGYVMITPVIYGFILLNSILTIFMNSNRMVNIFVSIWLYHETIPFTKSNDSSWRLKVSWNTFSCFLLNLCFLYMHVQSELREMMVMFLISSGNYPFVYCWICLMNCLLWKILSKKHDQQFCSIKSPWGSQWGSKLWDQNLFIPVTFC